MDIMNFNLCKFNISAWKSPASQANSAVKTARRWNCPKSLLSVRSEATRAASCQPSHAILSDFLVQLNLHSSNNPFFKQVKNWHGHVCIKAPLVYYIGYRCCPWIKYLSSIVQLYYDKLQTSLGRLPRPWSFRDPKRASRQHNKLVSVLIRLSIIIASHVLRSKVLGHVNNGCYPSFTFIIMI